MIEKSFVEYDTKLAMLAGLYGNSLGIYSDRQIFVLTCPAQRLFTCGTRSAPTLGSETWPREDLGVSENGGTLFGGPGIRILLFRVLY